MTNKILEKNSSFDFRNIVVSFKYFFRIVETLIITNKKYVIIVLILTLITSFFPMLSIIFTQNLINSIQNNLKQTALTLLIYLITINILSSIFFSMLSYIQTSLDIDISYKLKIEVLNKARQLNLRDFENSDIYDSLKRAQTNAQGKPFLIFSLVLKLASQVVTLISTAMILILWKWWIIIFVLIPPIVSSIYTLRLGYNYYLIQLNRTKEERFSWYLNFLLTNNIAFKEIKLYKLWDYFVGKFNLLNEKFIKQDKNFSLKQNIYSVVFGIFDQIMGGFLMMLIVIASYSGKILIGNTIAYIRCISNVQQSVQGILNTLTTMCQNNLYIKQIYDFLDLKSTERQIENRKKIGAKINDIEFRNISYKYDNCERYALKNINFKINAGENIAIVGENGSGKTTLIKLLTGLYENYTGEILINGISIKNLDLEDLRGKIGVIFQDYTNYNVTLRENVAFGDLSYINDDIKLNDALRIANVSEIFNNFPLGLNTPLGSWFDHGKELSGGQWQKVALARTFLKNSDIYVLDEPSSALDPLAEKELFNSTLKLTKNKIGIFITHRLINVKRISTNILVLKDGKLIEKGTHEELIEINSYYRYLYEIQNHKGFNDGGYKYA